jgi:hypothetical protein
MKTYNYVNVEKKKVELFKMFVMGKMGFLALASILVNDSMTKEL